MMAEEDRDMETYQFPSQRVHLMNQLTSNEPYEVDSAECLAYITADAEAEKILDDPLIKNNKELLLKMAYSDTPVNLFDQATWDDVDYSPLFNSS